MFQASWYESGAWGIILPDHITPNETHFSGRQCNFLHHTHLFMLESWQWLWLWWCKKIQSNTKMNRIQTLVYWNEFSSYRDFVKENFDTGGSKVARLDGWMDGERNDKHIRNTSYLIQNGNGRSFLNITCLLMIGHHDWLLQKPFLICYLISLVTIIQCDVIYVIITKSNNFINLHAFTYKLASYLKYHHMNSVDKYKKKSSNN